MKYALLSLLACLFLYNSNAQTPQYHWMNQLGGVDDDFGGYISTDKKGNVYTVSSISGSSSFNPGRTDEFKFVKSTSTAIKNLLITKVNSVSNLLWSKRFDGNINPYSVSTDSHSNIIVSGIFNNTADFDPSTSVFNLTAKGGSSDIFILKLDENGNFIWAGSIGSKFAEEPYTIVTDKNDRIALAFYFRDTIDVDMSIAGVYSLIPTSSIESAVVKYDSNGKLLWAHHLKDINPNALSFDSSGNLYSAGYFTGTKDFDFGTSIFNMTTTGAATSGDCYVLKEDTAGKFLWAKSFGEFINRDYADCIVVDKSQNVIVVGNYGGGNGDLDPGPGVVNLVGNTNYILKLNNAGNYIWAKGINGGIYPFDFISIGVDDSNSLYTTGSFSTNVDFDPGAGVSMLSPYVSTGNFILKLDSVGLFKWVNQIQNTSLFRINSLNVLGKGNIYLGGEFSLKADFDLTTSTKIDSAVGNSDVFTLKLSRCLLNNSISLNECKYFDYAGHRFDSSELVDVLFVTAAGCDSVVTVNMMVKTVNDTISAAGSVMTAKSTTATSYQWVNCPSYSAIAGATSASFTATVTGNYALIITENGCTDTSDCINVIGLGISEKGNKLAVSIYPNPSKDVFHLQFAQPTAATIVLSSIEGKQLFTQTMNGTSQAIDLSSYAAGVYFLTIRNQDGVQAITKLVKY